MKGSDRGASALESGRAIEVEQILFVAAQGHPILLGMTLFCEAGHLVWAFNQVWTLASWASRNSTQSLIWACALAGFA